ncbi:MAG: polysaccharide biosynthesis/export family protein [Pirellulaceae bacterium]
MKTHVPNRLARARVSLVSSLPITVLLGIAVLSLSAAGCTSLTSSVSGVPAHRLPAQFLTPPKNNLLPIDISRLGQEPPRNYLVDAEDILGIYVEGVLGNPEEAPPVHMPQLGSDLPPAIGFPIPVREDGTLALPLIPAIRARGLTLTQIENVIRRAYTVDSQILPKGKDRIIVTLIRKRTINVVVMRQDGVRESAASLNGVIVPQANATRGQVVQLEAYKNDVLHALAATGGLPGLDAKNEVLVLRTSRLDAQKRDAFVREFFSTPVEPCLCRPPLPDDPAILRIPLRLQPGAVPQFRPEDVILEEGDIVSIEGREREVFYTGGLLGGGEHQLPRDYDLDVLGAIAVVGKSVAGPGSTQLGGGFGVNSIGGVPPSQLFILRRTPCNGQITIAVDLNRAINDPAARPLVQAGDMLILQYKPTEELLNFGLGTFFTYGIVELLRND